MTEYMGIDGGGSTLRVAIVDDGLNVIAQAARGTANPSAIGRNASAALIHEAMREVLAAANVQVAAVGIGIAGASAVYASDWLTQTVQAVLPDAIIAPSIDNEIALVGAHGARRGAIVLAGTGSVALAITPRGERVQAGGWGYLLGDEGGGYWLAAEALRACIRWHDGTQPEAEPLARAVLEAFGFERPIEIIAWLYRQPPPIREVAAHAELVLDAAHDGDAVALAIVERGAEALAALAQSVCRRAGIVQDVRFCGGLLATENPLSDALCRQLHLTSIPQPLHEPVIGAALLAKLHLEAGLS